MPMYLVYVTVNCWLIGVYESSNFYGATKIHVTYLLTY